ncbi:hypothetical protein ACU8KH_00413 [Lachancea thermotolerans]
MKATESSGKCFLVKRLAALLLLYIDLLHFPWKYGKPSSLENTGMNALITF